MNGRQLHKYTSVADHNHHHQTMTVSAALSREGGEAKVNCNNNNVKNVNVVTDRRHQP